MLEPERLVRQRLPRKIDTMPSQHN